MRRVFSSSICIDIGGLNVVEDKCGDYCFVVVVVVMMMLRQHETETKSGAGQSWRVKA